jgi:FkbM family methyltransferase
MRLAERHFVYAPDLAQPFDTYFCPVAPQKKDGMLPVDYSMPRLPTYKKSGLQFELASLPEEDDAIQGYFRGYPVQPGDTVFDIGAHCGVSTYHFSRLVGPGGRVIAIDPDPLNYDLLLRNIERHNLDNVTAVKLDIVDSRGQAKFYCEGAIGSSYLASDSPRAAFGSVQVVETITLGDGFERWEVLALCKIDIERTEIEALAAARELLDMWRMQFTIDTNHFVNGQLTNLAVERLFSSCRYEVESLPIESMRMTWALPARL